MYQLEEYDLIQCIDRALDGFGSSVKNAIFLKMSYIHNSDTSEIIADPIRFGGIIEEIVGERAAEIEKSIINEIKKVFRLAGTETRTLVTTINAAKELLIDTFSGIASERRLANVQVQQENSQTVHITRTVT